MKRPLDEAAEIFRENQVRAGGDTEKANLYRGLAMLAEGVRRLEKELAAVESERQVGTANFYPRLRTRLVRREGRIISAAGTKAL